jgi:hypothetical protein
MKIPHFFSLALLFTFASTALTQEPVLPTEPAAVTADERSTRLRASALEFLRETYSDVGHMRALENRISFTAELASLLWYHDKNEAAAMFARAVGDFKQLLAVYDSQMNALKAAEADPDADAYGLGAFLNEPTDAARIAKKFRAAVGVRQQIALSIAEHEPDLAFNFFHDSLNAVTNADFRKQLEESNSRYEQELIARIAAANAKKGVELGISSLRRGFNSSHVDLLRKIYAKDDKEAVEFGKAVLSTLKNTGQDKLSDEDVAGLFRFGSTTLERSKKNSERAAVFSEADLRDIADILARGVLLRGDEIDPDTARSYAGVIEKVLPARAVQIRARYRGSSSEPRAPSEFTVSNETKIIATAGSGPGVPSVPSERQRSQQQLIEDQAKLADKELPKEERDRIVAQSRAIISRSSGTTSKIMALSALATTVATAGDKQLASEIMRDAAGLVNPQPKNYQDFISTLTLAAGYASADPEKAFPVLDDTIFRANEMFSAIVKLAEFVDVNEEVIAEGEFQVGSFGGQMIKGVTGMAGMADSTLRQLIDADFEKTKALANRFDRTEIRVLAKVLVLRTILDPKRAAVDVDVDDDIYREMETDLEMNEGSVSAPPPPPPPARRRP